ncbi:hypothetical protein PHLGIDRAFT_477117 [Phlebiopsis gigantea 11061_1 CR5-6]|uniref:Uncharacterized protein n=1 Tax=Phlebiopsis gigantea (strain 11061_1 CR5-6) TaxID=745531 RepID=A0A0C3NLU7_PHLG1|nr:hypothetical protein PHLGIDRAFT_477117 [Phlebiopsis gigantea 11061_1 CR5-6]
MSSSRHLILHPPHHCPRVQLLRLLPNFSQLLPILKLLEPPRLPILSLLTSSSCSRVYCSDECESLDSASPSISSAASSVYASPYLPSMKNVPGNLDVPALVPSALGHHARYSISSSSNSSTAWEPATDEEEADAYVLNEPYMLSVEGQKSPSALMYARRPSTTNHRSIVPTLHRHTHTSVASSSVSSAGLSHGLPSPFYACTEDDTSSLCISEFSLHDEHDTASARRKAKRTSLPAYFSLLQGSSVSSVSAAPPPATGAHARRHGVPSALQAISRSLQASPTTPKVSHATVTVSNAAAQAHIESLAPSTSAARPSEPPRGRGRLRERDADIRSASSRRSTARSPPRQPRQLSAAQRARIDSVEKVAEWVSASPVLAGPHGHARRNSSPQRKPRFDFVEALTRGLKGCAVDSEDDDADERRAAEREQYERTLRGRRRAEELDAAQLQDAPGLGNGRSGLMSRERGRAPAVRAVGIAIR